MNRLAALCLTLLLVLAGAGQAPAQDAATLVADRVVISGDTALVAEGNVEVLWQGTRLKARRISYDRAADLLTIEGPITLTEGESVAIFADAAELSSDLQDGILQSARLVLDQQLQLAAVQLARVGGRYTELDRVVASSCQVCAANPVPLWSIRARRVIHDQEARQIYFEGAQLLVADVPIAYIPRLRFPDPTLKRATGFLFPTLHSSSGLGTGIKLPYFVTLGRSADVTITPYLATSTRTLELRYRQAFRRGEIAFEGAVSDDDLMPGDTRAYVFGKGRFDMPADFQLSFGLQAVTDDAYLVDYGYSGADRLESSIALTRVRRDELIEARVLGFHTLREDEVNGTQPGIVGQSVYARRFVPGALGGIATLELGTLSSQRASDLDGDGRDVSRATASLGWERTEVIGPGILATGALRLSGDIYGVDDDTSFPTRTTRLLPEAGLTLRWPLAKVAASGATHIIEPMAMLGWSDRDADPVPNEDSVLVEFDEANLLSFSRFPGADGHEEGLRLALGLGWSRVDPMGWTTRVTFGRLFREEGTSPFGDGTGLEGDQSDWLAAVSVAFPNRLHMSGRALLNDSIGITKGDLRLGYTDRRFDLTTGLVYLTPAPAENRPDRISEWVVDTTWRINENWTGRADWRYDLEESRAARAGLGFGWANECLKVDLSLSRRFTSSTSLRPTTDFGLSVELTGFGTGGESGAPRRRCMN